MLLKLLRNGLGQIIIFFDFITRPSRMQRSPELQADVDRETAEMALYEFYACPFCVKTRRAFRRLNLNIERRDALNNPDYRSELETQGGKIKVPCLKITEQGKTRWMYESSDIIRYMDERFGADAVHSNA